MPYAQLDNDNRVKAVTDNGLGIPCQWDDLGKTWTGSEFLTTVENNPSDWWIYVGPFKDRLGMDAPAIAASSHDVCKGVMAMLADRKYVDLQGATAAAMLDLLIAANQPTANAFFPGSGPMTLAKKAAILGTKPTDSERYKGAA